MPHYIYTIVNRFKQIFLFLTLPIYILYNIVDMYGITISAEKQKFRTIELYRKYMKYIHEEFPMLIQQTPYQINK